MSVSVGPEGQGLVKIGMVSLVSPVAVGTPGALLHALRALLFGHFLKVAPLIFQDFFLTVLRYLRLTSMAVRRAI
jgi:hypothetical protein